MEDAIRTAMAIGDRTSLTGPTDQPRRESAPTPPELAKVLGPSRWEKRDEPFQGFESPPGKF